MHKHIYEHAYMYTHACVIHGYVRTHAHNIHTLRLGQVLSHITVTKQFYVPGYCSL